MAQQIGVLYLLLTKKLAIHRLFSQVSAVYLRLKCIAAQKIEEDVIYLGGVFWGCLDEFLIFAMNVLI